MWLFRGRSRGGAAVAVPTVDVGQAYARTKRGATLVDVRSPREFAYAGRPRGAVNVPPRLIKEDRTGLRRDEEILVICLSGHRSVRQARRLVEMGFTDVTDVHGGLLAWRRAGLPTQRQG